MLPVRSHVYSPVQGPATYNSTMKQAKLNFTILLLSKYADMLDPLDLNSVGKLIYGLSSLPTLNYKNLARISFYVFLCSSLFKTIYITAIFLGP